MKSCSPEIHWFCLCKTDGSLAAFLQVERAGTSRDGVEGWPSLKKKNSLQGVEMWHRFSLHIIIRIRFCFLTSCFYLSKESESIQSEAIDLMERSCRNTNSIAFSHLFLRGWTFKVRNVSTGCENKRDNPIKWQRHVLLRVHTVHTRQTPATCQIHSCLGCFSILYSFVSNSSNGGRFEEVKWCRSG